MLALFSKVDNDRCFLRRDPLEPLLPVEILGKDGLTGVGTDVGRGMVGTGGSEGSSGSKNV